MYIRIKAGTLVACLLVVALCAGIAYTLWNQGKADRLVQQILEANPMSEDRIDITSNGYAYTHPTEQKVSYEQALAYALEMVEEYPDHMWTQANSAYTLGQLYLKTGHRDEALSWFKKADSHWNEEAGRWISILERPDPDTAQLSLSGRVLMDGEPQADALVYLRPTDANSWYSPGYLSYPTVMTDQDGIYRFYDALPGSYEVGVAILPEQLEGLVRTNATEEPLVLEAGSSKTFDVRFVPKLETIAPTNGTEIETDQIRFEWEPYPEAVSYRINIQSLVPDENGQLKGRGAIGLQESWTDTEAVYEIAELRGYEGGVHYDTEGPAPQSILGIVYPGGHFSWSVDAYDAQGRKLSSSSSYYAAYTNQLPLFSLSVEGQLAGDRYVLARDYEAAIAAYKQEEHRQEAIRALGLIYAFGTDMREKGKDVELAKSYLNQLTDPTPFDQQILASLEREGQPR
ncbi:hypothetical protein [Paenibacillus daejeonensis]|uniref:hypothetical protein n=1 Tax=Paenibacillus daejeonensis TaxID=135193 RepID=UPI00037204EA|nr:hypothetical protein [Paenibacillus daejeonensis]